MDNKEGSKFLNQIAGFKVRIKELHWNAGSTAEHELCDKITDSINDIQDKTAEELQALFGKIKPGETEVMLPKATTTKAFLAELLKCLQGYLDVTGKDEKLVGIHSNMEQFISNNNIFDYLADMAVVNEGKKTHTIIVTEAQAKMAAGAKVMSKLTEGNGTDVTGVYTIGKNSVYVNEANSMLAVKDANKHILFESQGRDIQSLLNFLKVQGSTMENRGGFKTVLAEWLRNQEII